MPKSWDIRPSSAPTPRPQPTQKARPAVEMKRQAPRVAPAPSKAPSERVRIETHMVTGTRVQAPRSSTLGLATGKSAKGVGSLRERRKSKRKKLYRLISILLLLLATGTLIVLWQPFVRIQQVEATGPHAKELPTYVKTVLQGTRYGIFPKDSIFFLPTEEVRLSILRQYPDIEAVSLSAGGLNTLSISSTGRATAFWWCGTTYSPVHVHCFETDTSGKIFTAINASSTEASSTPFIVFSEFEGAQSTNSPLGGVIKNSSKLGDMLRFVKTLKGLGAPVASAEIRGDEADIYTSGGTRITYVLGREAQAASLAATAFPTLDVQGSSLLYIDLRFTSKIYFKKKESAVGTPTKVR